MRPAPALVLCAALAVTGCGSGPAPAARADQQVDDGLLAFVRCMRSEGIPLADPVVTGRDRVEVGPAPGAPVAGRAEFDRAVAACEARGHRRFGAEGDRDDGRRDHDREDRAVEFARCVRAHGVTLPDPRFDGDAVTNWDPGRLGIDLGDPAVVAIGETCAGRSGFDPWKEL